MPFSFFFFLFFYTRFWCWEYSMSALNKVHLGSLEWSQMISFNHIIFLSSNILSLSILILHNTETVCQCELMFLLIVKSRRYTNADSLWPPVSSPTPIQRQTSTLPGPVGWGLKGRASWKEKWEGLGAGQPISWHGRTFWTLPRLSKGSCSSLPKSCVGRARCQYEPFLFHMKHSSTGKIRILHFQNKKVNENLCSTSPQQSTPVKLENIQTHTFTLFFLPPRMIWNIFCPKNFKFVFFFPETFFAFRWIIHSHLVTCHVD